MKRASARSASTTLHAAAAIGVARAEEAGGHRIGFALVSADGRTLASLNATEQNYSGSISKAMSLVAYLRQTGAAQLGERRVGLLDAGLPGVVYAKEGWKPEPDGLLGSPYIVNQAGQFTYKGVVYGVAVTVGGVGGEAEGEAVVRNIVSALL